MENSLWVEKYRPNTLKNYVGNDHLKGIIKRYLGENDIQNLIFMDPLELEKQHLLNSLLKILIVSIFILMPLMKEVLKQLGIKCRGLLVRCRLSHLKWLFWMKLIFLLFKRRLHSVMSLKRFQKVLDLF